MKFVNVEKAVRAYDDGVKKAAMLNEQAKAEKDRYMKKAAQLQKAFDKLRDEAGEFSNYQACGMKDVYINSGDKERG